MRRFGTQGPVYPEKHYIVSRDAELDDFIARTKDGKYIVIFAPRQTGKTTFFRNALNEIAANDKMYFPISLNFEVYEDSTLSTFYEWLYQDICKEIEKELEKRGKNPSKTVRHFVENSKITDHLTMQRFLT